MKYYEQDFLNPTWCKKIYRMPANGNIMPEENSLAFVRTSLGTLLSVSLASNWVTFISVVALVLIANKLNAECERQTLFPHDIRFRFWRKYQQISFTLGEVHVIYILSVYRPVDLASVSALLDL